jgi:integrase/recombinase XerD
LVDWLADRGITHPGEITAQVLERYQRALHFYRRPDGTPLALPTRAI